MIISGRSRIIFVIFFRWIIESRAVTIEGKKYLVPGADFINHLDHENSNLPVSEIQVKKII